MGHCVIFWGKQGAAPPPPSRIMPVHNFFGQTATRSPAKLGSSSSSDPKEVETVNDGVYTRQMEMLDHLSQNPSMWSAEVLQAIALNHVSTTREMS